MHLWDAEHALGVARPIEPELAWDGVAEVVDILRTLWHRSTHGEIGAHAVEVLSGAVTP